MTSPLVTGFTVLYMLLHVLPNEPKIMKFKINLMFERHDMIQKFKASISVHWVPALGFAQDVEKKASFCQLFLTRIFLSVETYRARIVISYFTKF